jgi:hypothetical protein
MRRSIAVVFALALTLPIDVAARAGDAEAVSDSPFGVVCPWPGMQEAGIRWCRCGAGATAFANWPDIEKSPGVFDWTAADNELKQYADQYGLSLLPILGYSPKWASRTPDDALHYFSPPKDLTLFSRFVRQCVARYKHRVKVWEVWNEPNGFLNGGAAEYAEMVKAAAVAARQEDPDCRIAMGCAGVDIDFLGRLYEFGCGPYFDVMSVHPYQWGNQFNDGWMVSSLQACRDLMDRHGDQHKEIWLTEFGWDAGVTPQQQANLLVQAMTTGLSVRERLKVEKLFWFSIKDWGGPGFGLFDVDGKPKPAFVAYQAVTTELANARYLGRWKAAEAVHAHVFDRSGKPVLVVWNPSVDGKTQVEIPTSAAKLSVRTVANQSNELIPSDGKATIEATHAPVFVTGWNQGELELAAVPQSVASPPAAQEKASRDVWISVLPPPTTARPYLVLGGDNELPLVVHNDGREPARGELQIELAGENTPLATGQIAFDVPPGASQTVTWHTALPPSERLAGEQAVLHLRGQAGQEPLAGIDLPIRLARGKAVEFAANSWIERQYLHNADRSGCAESVRFGSEFGYRFDLHGARSARLRMNVGANGAQEWKVLVSRDGKEYTPECSGRSWPNWQTVSLDKYLADTQESPANVYVKIQGTDCQVREVILEVDTGAH